MGKLGNVFTESHELVREGCQSGHKNKQFTLHAESNKPWVCTRLLRQFPPRVIKSETLCFSSRDLVLVRVASGPFERGGARQGPACEVKKHLQKEQKWIYMGGNDNTAK